MKKIFFGAAFLFLFILVPKVSAATYYVDSVGGLDGNNGTATGTPWQTISKVNGSTFAAGDSILFKKGSSWREQLNAPSSGTSGNPITFGAYGSGNKPLISANDIISSFTTEVLSGTNYLTTDAPLSYWMFEDAATPSLDGSSNGNSLTWVTSNNSRQTDHIQGTYSLTGTGIGPTSRAFASLSANFPAKAATTAFTVGFWTKSKTSFTGFQNLVAFSNGSSQGYVFSTNGSSGIRLKVYGNVTAQIDSNSALNDGNWHHVVGRWDGAQVTMWIDGVKQTTHPSMTSVNLVTASNFNVTVGTDNTGIDELFVYPKGITDAAIQEIYNTGLDGQRGAVTSYYASGYGANPTTVIVDGQLIQNVTAKGSLVANSWWYDSVNGRVYLHDNPSGHVVEIGARSDAISTNGKSYVTFDGFDLQGGKDQLGTYRIASGSGNTTLQNSEVHNAFNAIQAGGGSGNNQLVQGNVIHTGYANGIVSNEGTTTGWRVLNNEIYDFGNIVGGQTIGALNPQGIFFNVADALVDGNYFHDINTVLFTVFQHAIYTTNTVLTARNNTFINIGCYGVKVSLNSNNSLIYNNVMYKTAAAVGVFGSTGIQIYNNVMWGANNQSVSGRLASGIYLQSYLGVDSTVTLLKNNIIGENLYFGATTQQLFADVNNTITNSDYNDIWSSTGNAGNQIYYQGNNYTFAQWQGLGKDAHSSSLDPKFVNVTSNNFHLQSTSPSINAGTDVGLAYAGIAPDQGAFEYTTAPVISAISSGTPGTATATITWTTDEASDSQVQYGTSTSYGSTTTLDANLVTSHSVVLSGLTPSTTYHFAVVSKDALTNSTTSVDQTFATTAAPVIVTPSASTTGGYTSGGGAPAPVVSTTPPSTAPASTANCNPGDLFSAVTGAPCSTVITTPPIAVTGPIGTPAPAAGMLTLNLSLSVTNVQVKLLQQYLNAHGYVVAKSGSGSIGHETTYFGPATKAALIKFQKAHGLEADGRVGPATRTSINK